MAIQGFASPALERFFLEGVVPARAGWAGVAAVVARKLDMLHAAHALADLRVPPANRLEALQGDLRGMHSIRVNRRWRVVFRWSARGPKDVAVVDYH